MSHEHSSEPDSAEAFLASEFPDMSLCLELPGDTPELMRGRAAGIGVAEVFLYDGTSFQATYIFEDTAYTEALRTIYEREAWGFLPVGSHEEAIDSIFNGEFDDQWGAYLGPKTL